MKGKRFTEEQIIGVLRESEAGAATKELCRRHGISEQTLLPLEGEVRRHGGQRRQEAAGARGRKPALEAHRGRADAGHRGP